MQKRHQHQICGHTDLLSGTPPSLGQRLVKALSNTASAMLTASLLIPVANESSAQGTSERSYLGNSRYIEVSAGTGLGRLRDFATSPLFYQGPVHRIGGTLSRLGSSRDVTTGIATTRGNLKNDYNDHESQGTFTNFSIHHARLYQILKNGSDRWNFKVGGEANISGNLRVNQSFRNSAVGIEAFPIVFGTFKATKNLTRAVGKKGAEPRKKSLSLKVSASLLSASIRNGYSYLGIGQVVDKSELEGLLEGYRFKAFGVNSLNTSLDYTLWLKNKNGWRFSYGWEAYKTRKDYADFEMAIHSLRVALLFNSKNN